MRTKSKPVDDYVDDDFEEDDPFEDDDRSSRGRGRSNRKHAPKKQGPSTGLIIGLVVGGMVAFGLILGVIVWLTSGPAEVAQPNNPNPVPNNNLAGNPNPAPFNNPTVNPNPAVNPNPVNPAVPQPIVPNNVPPAAPGAEPWFVLSNLRQEPRANNRPGVFGTNYQVDYRLASGTRDGSKSYYLYVRSGNGGPIERYTYTDLPNTPSGTMTFSVDTVLNGSNFVVSIANRNGRDFSKVSGELGVGGGETTATPPPTVQQLAGPGAQGKTVAIANLKVDRQGFMRVSFDYVLQGPMDGIFYSLVIKDPSGNVVSEADMSHELRRSTVGVRRTFNVQILGVPTNIGSVHVEKNTRPPGTRFDKQPGEVVSNIATVQ